MTPAKRYYNSIKEDRRAWRAEHPQICMLCGNKPDFRGLQIHEIERRAHAGRNWWHKCTALLVCAFCHHGVLETMSHAEQLAYKLVRDREHFDLKAWLAIKPRPESYVTMEEIMEFANAI